MTGSAWAAEAVFVRALQPAEFAAAGLAKLTPAELANLEAAVQRFKAGEVALVQQRAEAKEVQEADKKKPGWLTAIMSVSPGRRGNPRRGDGEQRSGRARGLNESNALSSGERAGVETGDLGQLRTLAHAQVA